MQIQKTSVVGARAWRSRTSGALLTGAFALPSAIALPAVALPGAGPATVTPPPVSVRMPSGPAHARMLASSGLSISVTDGRTEAKAGDELDYQVSVQNTGSRAVPHLLVTQTLSQGLRFLSATDQGAADAGRIRWQVGIGPGQTREFHVLARVTRTPPHLLRLAAVACAEPTGSSTPTVCAAHLDRLPVAASNGAVKTGGLSGYAIAALAALLAGALAMVARRRLNARSA